jgi:glutathione peroxidase
MKKLSLLVLSILMVAGFAFATSAKKAGPVYTFKAKTIDGKSVKLSAYRGKTLLIVNVASKCGYTPQYEGLEKLHEKYKDQGLVILGFPCNQFGGQEPGTSAEIKSFCESKYNVKFQLLSKIDVNGAKAHPLYQYLKKATPGKEKGDIGWNFTKFLIDTNGYPVKRFASSVKPEELENDLKETLKPTTTGGRVAP